ncbi:TetR/AcrR family transcriptional regulator [Mycobacterium sp. DL592]|uniref:TetR/AcrR family transcriptional regulator n=1 Tax=Mycobacterium sp. DL592 TaxID=2675524 RepID=UPI001FB89FEA|nr:TetR/AcrR family transcriptional regulator [Mycobacterium sp. DL592]
MPTAQNKPRRTQEERSAATRARLLDATVECLTTHGYAGTTTPRIAEVAGLTRGAQIHHFGSKHELMTAAMHHMTAKTVTTVVTGFRDGFTRAADPIGAVLELIWQVHVAPGFVPVVELWVAGRTDPELAREVAKFAPIAASAVTAAVLEPVPHHLHSAMLEFVYTAMDTLRGILIPSFVDADKAQARRRWETATTVLRRTVHEDLAAWLASANG